MAPKKPTTPSTTIAANKKAGFEYHLEERFEAGLVLEGWEIKSLRAGKAQLTDSYVIFKDGEAFLLGARITPLPTASTHIDPDPTRTRKLLLNRRELNKLIGAVQAKGYTCLCTRLYWKRHLVKAQIALARGKQKHDKRETERARDWGRQKQRLLREANK